MDQKDIIKSIQKFIQIPSISGEEKKAAEFIRKLMINLNYDEAYIDSWGNVVGKINGKSEGTILLEGHLDTVSVNNKSDWKYDPFSGYIDQNKIYGRGSSDMKSALITMIYAAAAYNNNSCLEKNIVVAGTIQEELYEGVAQANIINNIKPDLVIIGEASSLNLCIGQRGRAEIKLTTYGQNAHSSNPKKGINAIKKMNRLLNKINNIDISKDKDLGEGILEIVDIKSIPYPGHSVIPHRCTATFDRRLLPGEDKIKVLKPIRKLINKIGKEDINFKAEVGIAKNEYTTYKGKQLQVEKFFPGWKFDKNENLIESIFSNLKNVNPKTEIDYYSFCTNGSYSAGIKNILTLGYGPSQEDLAHIIDEYIEISQIEKAYQGYINIIETFLDSNI